MSGIPGLLRELAGAGRRVAPKAPGDLGTALELGALGVDLVAAIVEMGGDAKVVIPQLRDHLTVLLPRRAALRSFIDDRFPRDTEPVAGPPSGVGHETSEPAFPIVGGDPGDEQP